jgi:hypothetical protein
MPQGESKLRNGAAVFYDDGELVEEEVAFRRKLPRLLRSYRGQYVAIHKGRVAGHGPDDEDLALRMYEKFGNAVLLIARVEEEPSVLDLPSPEGVR